MCLVLSDLNNRIFGSYLTGTIGSKTTAAPATAHCRCPRERAAQCAGKALMHSSRGHSCRDQRVCARNAPPRGTECATTQTCRCSELQHTNSLQLRATQNVRRCETFTQLDSTSPAGINRRSFSCTLPSSQSACPPDCCCCCGVEAQRQALPALSRSCIGCACPPSTCSHGVLRRALQPHAPLPCASIPTECW
jgi:hypothetical protein